MYNRGGTFYTKQVISEEFGSNGNLNLNVNMSLQN